LTVGKTGCDDLPEVVDGVDHSELRIYFPANQVVEVYNLSILPNERLTQRPPPVDEKLHPIPDASRNPRSVVDKEIIETLAKGHLALDRESFLGPRFQGIPIP
jgi:hypothetical protein